MSKKKNEIEEKEEEPFFQEVITFTVPEFRDFIFDVKDFCNYYKGSGRICPFIKADADPNRKFKHIFNFDAQNCMWLCKWFQRQNLPALAKRVERLAPNEK